MKKSVILIISVIYALAIVFVGRMIQTQVYNPTVYVTEIEVLNDDFQPTFSESGKVEPYDGKISLDYQTNLTYELKCRAYPYNATNTLLTYIFDEESNICDANVTNENTLLLNFKKKGPFPVSVKARDGSGVQISIFIEAVKDII